MTTYWILWFTITVLDGEILHFPVDTEYADQAACEADLPEWQALIENQFPDDPNLRVYCEACNPTPTKEL